MIEIRILDENKDESLLDTAWKWEREAPEWFKEVQSAHKETFIEFLTSAKTELLAGIFIDNNLSAVIRFVPQDGMHELHLMAKRGTDFNLLLEACKSIKEYVFERGVEILGGWVARVNRPVIKLYRLLGFAHLDNRTEGTVRGKPAEWWYFEARKSC